MWQPNGPRLNFLYRLLMLLFFFFLRMLCNWTATCHTIICSPWSGNGEHLFKEQHKGKIHIRTQVAVRFGTTFLKLLLSKVFYKTEKEISWWDVFIFRRDKIKYARGSNISLDSRDIKRGMRIFKHLYFIAPMHFWVCICLFSLPTSEPKILNYMHLRSHIIVPC